MDIEYFEKRCNSTHENTIKWLLETLEIEKESRQFDLFLENLTNKSLDKLILAIATSSPAHFAEYFCRNRPEFAIEEGRKNEPWRLYPDQWDALSYGGDLLLSGAAGTGKTRHFAVMALYVAAFRHATVLVVAHTEPARDQLHAEMVYQIERTSFLRAIFPESLIRSGNPKRISTADGYGTIKFLLSQDGKMILGTQIGRGGYVICDEAVMYKDVAWPAIESRQRAGSTLLAGCVPYGVPNNKFEQKVKKAIPLSSLLGQEVQNFNEDADELPPLVKVQWDRTEQPYWTKREALKAIQRHGPVGGWEHNVYVRGIPSAGEGKVFTEDLIDRAFGRIPLYRRLNVVWDTNEDKVFCSVQVALDGINIKNSIMRTVSKDTFLIKDFVADILVDGQSISRFAYWVVSSVPSVPVHVAGVDLGKVQDLNILSAFSCSNDDLALRWTLSSLYVPYGEQGKLYSDLLRYKKQKFFCYGVGLEACGHNAGSLLYETMVNQCGTRKELITTFSWLGTKVDIKDKDRKKKTERQKRRHRRLKDDEDVIWRSLKHHSTVLIKEMIKQGRFRLPACDGLVLKELQEHAGVHKRLDFEYDDNNDHHIESFRVLVLRYHEVVLGSLEIARVGRHSKERFQVPRNKRLHGTYR